MFQITPLNLCKGKTRELTLKDEKSSETQTKKMAASIRRTCARVVDRRFYSLYQSHLNSRLIEWFRYCRYSSSQQSAWQVRNQQGDIEVQVGRRFVHFKKVVNVIVYSTQFSVFFSKSIYLSKKDNKKNKPAFERNNGNMISRNLI